MTDRQHVLVVGDDAHRSSAAELIALAATRSPGDMMLVTDRPPIPLVPIADEARALMTKTAEPTDRRQSLRAVELLLPRALYDRLEDLRAVQAPALTLPDFLVKLLPAAAQGLAGAIEDLDRAGRLVVER